MRFFAVLLATFFCFFLPDTTFAADHIKVTKEVLLEHGVSISPSTIVQTKDGGYVTPGGLSGNLGWATRVDANGKMIWRYQIPIQGESNYTGAISLGDDTTLLCGYKSIHHPTDLMPGGKDLVGVLTHIDIGGKVLSDIVIRPKELGEFPINYIKGCKPWGDGFAVFGSITRVFGDPHHPPRELENFY